MLVTMCRASAVSRRVKASHSAHRQLERMCLAGFVEDAPCALLPSILGGYNMPGQRHQLFSSFSSSVVWASVGVSGGPFLFLMMLSVLLSGWPKMPGIMDEKDSCVD